MRVTSVIDFIEPFILLSFLIFLGGAKGGMWQMKTMVKRRGDTFAKSIKKHVVIFTTENLNLKNDAYGMPLSRFYPFPPFTCQG